MNLRFLKRPLPHRVFFNSNKNIIDPNEESVKILVVRPDRLGDVILSTPVLEVLKRHYPKSQLTFLVKENVRPILEGLLSVDHLMIFDPQGRHAGIKGFFQLCTDFKEGQFRIVIVLQSQWKIALALFLARVRYRVGPLSKLHSFLFYNRGLRQRRSQVEMHEADYNLQLLRRLGIRVGSRSVSTRIHVSEDVALQATQWLKVKLWNPQIPLVVIHPGMGGSALNWPESHYGELIQFLLQDGYQVLVTGGPTESDLIDRLEKVIGTTSSRVFYCRNTQLTPIDFLAGLFKNASLVVAPSTGPLHLAVALGKPVLTFYPPIRVQSAIRWGPYLSDEAKASILVPEVYCGQDFKCLGSLCNYFPCMKSLTVKQATEQARLQLRLSDPHP